MKFLLPVLLAVVLSACAINGVKSPFVDRSPENQIENATRALDPERRLAVSYMAAKAVRANGIHSAALLTSVSNALLAASKLEGITFELLDQVLDAAVLEITRGANLYPEDQLLVDYLKDKLLALIDPVDMPLPLSAEQRRVLGVYGKAIQDGISTVSTE